MDIFPMSTPFNEASYLTQVRRLRQLAKAVLKKYPIKSYDLHFINHVENTTFKVITPRKSYLLRLHRRGYHSRSAILEELIWLKNLSETTHIPVQQPILSKRNQLIEQQGTSKVPSRYCSLLEWQSGRIRFHSLTPQNFQHIGELIALLHKSTFSKKVKHRKYWTSEGLLGDQATCGSLHPFKELYPKIYPDLEKCRNLVFKKISSYQRKNPSKLLMIHADFHFGNIIWSGSKALPIDFDDCGLGIHLYDLAVTMNALSSSTIFKGVKNEKSRRAANSLLEGYSTISNLSKEDLKTLPYFILTRKLMTLAWCNDRRDNPGIAKYLDEFMKKYMRDFRKFLINGPSHII